MSSRLSPAVARLPSIRRTPFRPPSRLNPFLSLNYVQKPTSNPRTMSSSTAAKKEFLCIIPDRPGTLSKRIEVRPKHLELVMPLVQNGTVTLGGGMFESHPNEGETPKFTGSALIFVGESVDHVRRALADDIYATSGVWDLDNMKVIPFRTAVRAGM